MPQAQVAMDVRKVSGKVNVIDVKGELTAFVRSAGERLRCGALLPLG
jgi:hypothetical protein